MTLERAYGLTRSQLEVGTVVQNNSRFARYTSMGEHYYFALPEGPESVEGVTIQGQTIDELLQPGAIAGIRQGESQFWPDFEGMAHIKIPGTGDIRLGASFTDTDAAPQEDTANNLGLMLWQRPGRPFVCIEPTVGFGRNEDGQFVNTGLVIRSYGRVAFSTTIAV
ncbi:MAG: hypothetical protein AAB834_08285 [Patescibacteria group bacterium]